MNKSEITKNVMKNTANMVLQDALDILEADDGKSFDEKRDAVIKLLTQKGDTELSRLLSERTVADKTGVEIKTDFWKSGTVILVIRFISDLWSPTTVIPFSPFREQAHWCNLWRTRIRS